MSTKGENAKQNFLAGYNCAQSVILAFAEETGLSKETALMISSGFGGGMGRTRNVCGAVSGMIMAANMLYGYTSPTASADKKAAYQTVQALIKSFKEKNGSIICGELLGLNKGENNAATPTPRNSEYYKKRPCALLVMDAGDILEQYISENPPQRKA